MAYTTNTPSSDQRAGSVIPFAEAVKVWARIAALSFGGPAGQIAVMHRIIVDEKRWIDEHRFLRSLNYCMLLPVPEAQQLAVYIGWLMHRAVGGFVAGGLFILPVFIAILGLSYIYATFGSVGLIAGLFFGLKAAVSQVLGLTVDVPVWSSISLPAAALTAAAVVAIFRFKLPMLAVLAACVTARIGWSLMLR